MYELLGGSSSAKTDIVQHGPRQLGVYVINE